MFIFSFIYEKDILGNTWKYLSENKMLLVGQTNDCYFF